MKELTLDAVSRQHRHDAVTDRYALVRIGLIVCLTIVAAFEARLIGQSTISEDVPVPGGTSATAAALGIEPVPDRARFVAELARQAYDVPPGRNAASDARLDRLKSLVASMSRPSVASSGELVPLPLTTALWSQAVFHRPLTSQTVFVAILGDREASLICRGLAALDDDTLTFFAEHPAVLTGLYERSATAFAAFGGNLRIRAGRVVPPGGADAVPLWEAVVGERVDRPDRFVRELFEQREGRTAYVYDTIADVDSPSQAFALGLWIDDPRARADRFKALIASTADAYRDWRVKTFPFARPLSDLATLLARVRTDERGRPALASRTLWARAFDIGETDDAAHPVDAAWLADVILSRDLQVRADRLDQYGFGMRVFRSGRDSDLASVDEALHAFPRSRMLMLSLERIGITDPAMYAEAARRASRLSSLDGERGFAALAQFQGALALIVRMARVHSLEPAKVTALVGSLIGCEPNREGRYGGAIVEWLNRSLRPELPAAPGLEAAVLTGLAGRPVGGTPLVAWEGQQYRLDLAAAELRRLRRIRDKQGGYTLDLALAIETTAATLASDRATAGDLDAAGQALKATIEELIPKTRADPTTLPPGVGTPKNVREIVERAVKDLAKNGNTPELSKRASIAESLSEVADRIAADALASLAYAVDIGDADSAILLAGNVAVRHDFGFALRDNTSRVRIEWGLPKPDVAPGMPWRIRGSLLGLDVGLSSLALRRINADRIVGAPQLTSNERETFSASLAMMNAFALRDEDRDAIGEALRRGRSRVLALTADTFDSAAAAIGMDGWRVRAGRWLVRRDAAGELPSLFSTTELLQLGGGAGSSSLDEWGMSGIASVGCICLQLTPPGRWQMWTGRPQLGVIAINVADLNLHIAEVLYDLRLPAALARHVLSAAVQDFIDEVQPTDPNDWLTLVRAAQAVSRERVEDYIAAAAADGPLVPEPSAIHDASRMP